MSASTPKKNSFFGGAAILTASVIVVKLIGALYKVPLGNILTDAAFADFNTAYDIYSLLIIISTGGLPVALSKMVSEANALNRGNQVKKVFSLALAAFCILGTASFCIMAFLPQQLADLMQDSHAAYSILALAPAVFFICPMSAMRGYFQGHAQMTPTAVSQVIEALCKLTIGLALASAFKKSFEDEAMAAAGAILGVSVGCLLGAVYMYFCYRRHSRAQPRCNDEPEDSRTILATLAALAIPITLSSSVIALTNILDNAILMGRLQDALKLSLNDARTLKGVYNKALTLYNLPASFMVPLTASVIPHVSAALKIKRRRQAAQISETALRTTALLSIPAGVGLFVLGEPIIRLLYASTDVVEAGWMLSVLGVASIAVCFMLVCNSILQAYQMVALPMATTVVGCAMKLAVGYVLIGNPDIGIRGGAISTVVCFWLIALLDLFIIRRTLPRSLSLARVFVKPAGAAAAMGAAAWAVHGLSCKAMLALGVKLKASIFVLVDQLGDPILDELGGASLSRTGVALSVFAAIGVAMIVYFALILVTKAISKEDLSLLPKGERIARILRVE
ncbi:MAG: oligosaccharide flippase family protein [Oscillospiraceae bacterium]|nr:oligosaccharide flippase family protein [Oscillospiraceae bacterium]